MSRPPPPIIIWSNNEHRSYSSHRSFQSSSLRFSLFVLSCVCKGEKAIDYSAFCQCTCSGFSKSNQRVSYRRAFSIVAFVWFLLVSMCQYDWSSYTYLHVCNYTTIENKPQKRRPYNCVCVCEGESTCVCLSVCLLVTTKQQRKCCPHFVGLFQQFVCHFQPHTLRHLLTHFHSHSLPHTLAHSHTHLFNLLTRKQFSIIS